MSAEPDLAASVLVIIETIATGLIIILGWGLKGTRTGKSLQPRSRILGYLASVFLLLVALANVVLILYRLFTTPENAGNKHEFAITVGAFVVLWFTDILRFRPAVRRRHKVAEYLACFPTFRFGSSGRKSPIARTNREFVVRSASWQLFGLARQRTGVLEVYWRGVVAFCGESQTACGGQGGSVVVLQDYETQDGAGAELLTPSFLHASEFHKQHVADIIWKAVLRSGIWNVHFWDNTFAGKVISELKDVHGVTGIVRGELGRKVLDKDEPIHLRPNELQLNEETARLLCCLIWAALTREVFNFIQNGGQLRLLYEIVNLPMKIRSAEWTAERIVQACKDIKHENN